MTSQEHGQNTSAVEITNISKHGVWILTHGQELFMAHNDFPWFQDQTVSSISNVEEQAPGHYYWPDIDVDLSIETIKHPERFPLKAKKTKATQEAA